MKNKNQLKTTLQLKPSIYEFVTKNLAYIYLCLCLKNLTKAKVVKMLKLIGRDSIFNLCNHGDIACDLPRGHVYWCIMFYIQYRISTTKGDVLLSLPFLKYEIKIG